METEKLKKQELIKDLQNKILYYDKILFIFDEIQEIAGSFNKCQRKLSKKFLLLSKNTVNNDLADTNCTQIEEKDSKILRHLYHTYEFSNKFTMLSADSNFGTIWNYVKTGILTSEEALSAVLNWS